MKVLVRATLGAVVLAAAARAGAAVPPRLEVVLEPATVTVGDPITVSATLELEERGREVSFAVPGPRWGEAERLDEPSLERAPAGTGERLRWTWRAAVFRPGRFELPNPVVRLAGDPPLEVFAPAAIRVEVRSVLAGDQDSAPAPPAPPRPLPLGRVFWGSLAFLAAAVVAAAIALARRTPTAATASVPAVPPFAELERALAALGGAGAIVGHAELSRALRRYLGRALAFPALESTTAEIARRLGRRGAVDPGAARRIRRLLGDCDGVKFALRPADAAVLESRRAEALAVARELELALAPAPPLAPPGGAP